MCKDKRKIMVLGGSNAAKKIILSEICDKTIETVAMEYGNALIGDLKIHFFSVPSTGNFKFMYQVLSKDTDGAIILIDKEGLNNDELKTTNTYKENKLPFMIIAEEENKEKNTFKTDLKDIPLFYTDKITEENISNGIEILLEMIDSARNLEKTHIYAA